MIEIAIPDGVKRSQVRMYCPMCGRQVPLIFSKQRSTSGWIDVCYPVDPCPYCGTKRGETTAVNQYAYFGVRTT